MDQESTVTADFSPIGGERSAEWTEKAVAGASGIARAMVFVDADNQSPTLAGPLLRFLSAIGYHSGRVFIAGNGSGDRVNAWQAALEGGKPTFELVARVTSMRKQSADVHLVFELARFYHRQPDSKTLILIVSRDDLLLAAAESLSAEGHQVLVAVGSATPAIPLTTEMAVVVLPLPQTSVQQVSKETVTGALEQVPSPMVEPLSQQIVNAAINKIRQSLAQGKGGGYDASAVGQVLSKMGHDKTMRDRIVQAIPNLEVVGRGAEKKLIF